MNDKTINTQQFLAYAGTSPRMMEVDADGNVSANQDIITGKLSDAPTIALLEDDGNWNISGTYIGTAITGTFEGQYYFSNGYYFIAHADNTWIRLSNSTKHFVTVGTDGEFTTIESALIAGHRKIMLVSDITLAADTTDITDYCEITALKESYTITIDLDAQFENTGVDSGYIFRGVTLITSTSSPIQSSSKAIFYNCHIISNVTAYWAGVSVFYSCYLVMDASLFSNGGETLYDCTIALSQDTYLAGKQFNCTIIGAGGWDILNGEYYSCNFSSITIVNKPFIVDTCVESGSALTIQAFNTNAKITNNRVSNITITNIGQTITNNSFSGNVIFNGTADYTKFAFNIVDGSTTLNAGAANNVIIGNTLTGGLTDNSGEVTNEIQFNVE